MQNDRDDELLSRFWALHAAIIRRDGLEERMRAGLPLDSDLLDRSLAAAEHVLEARAGLYRHLMDAGWTPPDEVVKDLVYDETVLSETDGAVHG
jgi:hypothetical protein